MKGEYEPDTFTESDVLRCLDTAGKRYKRGSRYILAQCPTHEDEHPSVQIYKDDWFVNCHAGCGRYHITKGFPELRQSSVDGPNVRPASVVPNRTKKVSEHNYIPVDLMRFWESLPEIPQDHFFKGIPIEVLHDLGWRYDPVGDRYFIPYFSASKGSIPFAQWRNLASGPRFNFWKDAKPTCYGTWNLDNDKLFVCEGTSDAAVLDYCAVPWIALPSAASGELMKKMATHCKENGIQLIYAGDNDSAGDKLKDALDEVMSYRVKQPPKDYKDWGDFFEAKGYEAVQDYCNQELFPPDPTRFGESVDLSGTDATLTLVRDPNASIFDTIDEIFPGAEKLEDPRKSKEQSQGSSSV